MPFSVDATNYNFELPEGSQCCIVDGSCRGKAITVKVFPNCDGKLDPKFRREAMVLSHLAKKPLVGVCQLIGVTVHEHMSSIALEPFSTTLRTFLTECSFKNTSETKALFRDICRAVKHVHAAGVAHLDLNPDNILVDQATRSVTLCNFINSHISPKKLEKQDTVVVQNLIEAEFAEPQALTNAALNPFLADIYSLGCVYYYILRGSAPDVNDEGVVQSLDGLSPEAAVVIRMMLDSCPTKRPSIDDLIRHPSLAPKRVWKAVRTISPSFISKHNPYTKLVN